MHNPPRITIVTPSFNQGRFLARTIQSVIAQEYDNLEYIVVDGGSTDESHDILRQYADRLTNWISEPDHGQADAIMKGFHMSTGDIMAWLNSDDLLMPNSLATVAASFTQSNDIQMIYGDCVVIDEHDQLLGIVEQIPARFETLLYGGHIINQEAVFWKRELYEKVGGLNKTLQYALDYDLWVRMARHKKPRHVPTILSAFRPHQLQKSSRMDLYNLEKRAIQQDFRQRLGEGELAFALKSVLWRTLVSVKRQASRLNRRSAPLIRHSHLVKIPDYVVRLVQFYGAAWLYGYHSDGWLRRLAAFALRGEERSRKLGMKYLTHGLSMEGVLKVKVWEIAKDQWNELAQSELQIRREGGVLEIEVPPSASPIVVIHFDFEKCRVLAARSLKSLLGRDFRSVSIHITDLDSPTGYVPNLHLKRWHKLMAVSCNGLLHNRLANLRARVTDLAQEGGRLCRPVPRLGPGEQSGVRGLKAAPLGREPGYPPYPPQPEVSVIVGLPAHYGQALRCVESWVREQTYPRECFEVIVMTDGSDPALDRRVKELLGLQDRMICHATSNQLLLCDLGARQARGKLLLITESHCIAEPECLEEVVRFLATDDYDAACCRSVGICTNNMARMAERLFDADLRTWLRQGDLRKVVVKHGFAIYRDIYVGEGGFEHAFSDFAGRALAVKLHSQGRRLGYAAGAVVRHYYTPSIREQFLFVRDFTRGECAYWASYPVDYCERYFGYAEEWTQRESFRPSLARAICQASWRSLWGGLLEGGGWSMVAAQAKALCRSFPAALLGPRGRLLSYRWSLWMAMARCWLWCFNEEKAYRAYCDAYDLMIRYSRLEFIAEQLAATAPAPPEASEYRPAELPEEWLVGFHAVERWGEDAFRWSGPVSLVRLRVPVGAYDVQIETRSLRQAAIPLCLGVFFNRHKVPSSSIQFSNGLLSFRIHSSMFEQSPEQRLIVTCNPLRPWKFSVPDRRELGLPIFSIEFTPVEEEVSAPDALPASTACQTSMAQKTT